LYADHFSCVEINSSFHRPHQPATYARWRDETPPHFRFSVKMPRTITHESHLRRAAADVSRFYEEIGHLQPKLAAVLIQLPPSLEFSAAIVGSFFNALPRLPRTAVTCEPRHKSWFSGAADEALRRVKVTRVDADPARCAGAEETGGVPGFAYYRWHGVPQIYYSKYSDEQLAAFAVKVKTAGAKDAWCVFDNTARYAAWDNALRFIALLRSKKLMESARAGTT
jgi:uncharacterized protein YecE (DUF72 family)